MNSFSITCVSVWGRDEEEDGRGKGAEYRDNRPLDRNKKTKLSWA